MRIAPQTEKKSLGTFLPYKHKSYSALKESALGKFTGGSQSLRLVSVIKQSGWSRICSCWAVAVVCCCAFLLLMPSAFGEATVPDESETSAAAVATAQVLSPQKQQFIADIEHYNKTRNWDTLLRIRSYIGTHNEDEERLWQLGRDLVIDEATADLLLDVTDYALRTTDIAGSNNLGLMVLRLDAGGLAEGVLLRQQLRFASLLDTILALPTDAVHPFTRYMARQAKGRIVDNAPKPEPQVLQSVTDRRTFEIFGTDYNAVQSVATMARALESIVGDYLMYIDDFPQPLWVRIEAGASRVPNFELQVSESGNVGIVLFWNTQTSMEEVAQALSWALLQRIAIWRWNVRDEDAVPYWLLNALAEEIPVQMQSARNQGLVRSIDEEGNLLPLTNLLNKSALDGVTGQQAADVKLQSLWFYRFLRDQASSRQMFGLLIEAFLSDKDGMQVLRRAFPGQLENAQIAQQWWEVGLSSLVHRQRGIVYSMQKSREQVAALDGVTAWWEGQDRRLRGPALLPLREDPRWQSAFWRQQRELKLELQRINPIYFNALLSLGRFYDLLLARGGGAEVLSNAELRVQAEAAYGQFLDDWAHAQALHRAVNQALQQGQE